MTKSVRFDHIIYRIHANGIEIAKALGNGGGGPDNKMLETDGI